MPYLTIADLPPAIRLRLPGRAQKICRGAFNHAWRSFAANADREGTAHRVAWAAVKRRYREVGDAWVAAEQPLR